MFSFGNCFLGVVLLLGVLVSCARNVLPKSSGKGEVSYKMSFVGEWTESRQGTLPFSAHFTTLTGVVHVKATSLFDLGTKATVGIKDMAETGDFSELEIEVNEKFVKPEKGSVIRMDLPYGGTALASVTLNVDTAYQRITMVSMVAPTPDWFIAFEGDLKDSNGLWKDSVVIDAVLWDAGTANGDDLSFFNAATDPPENIRKINQKTPFVVSAGAVRPRLAKLELVRIKGGVNKSML